MHLTKAFLLAALAGNAISAPVADPEPQPEAAPEAELAERQLLAGISPSVVQLLQNFGLGSLAPVGGVLTAVGDAVKRDVEDIQLSDVEKRQLLSSVSTSLGQLLSGLGLGTVGTPITGLLGSLSGIIKRDVDSIEDLSDIERRQLLSSVSTSLGQLLSGLGLGTIGTPITGLLGSLSGIVKRDVEDLNDMEKRQLLSSVSTSLGQLLSGLGLGTIGTPITGLLGSLSGIVKRDADALNELSDMEKRQLLSSVGTSLSQLLSALGLSTIAPVGDIVGSVGGVVKRDAAVEDIELSDMEKRQLLAALASPTTQLLQNFGLGSLSPVGGILTAVSGAVKRDVDALNEVEKRQLLANLSPSVVQLLQNFGLGSLSPVGGVLTAVGDAVKRDVDSMNDVEKRQLLANLSPSVVQLLNNFGLGSLSPAGGVLTAVGTAI